MARIHTHYDNLKVARDAPPEVIRAAYKSLSQKYHPDRHGGSASANRIIQIINTSYEVLSDPVKRREHDDWIAKTEGSGGAAAAKSATAQSAHATPQPVYTQWRTGPDPARRHRRRFSRTSRYDVAAKAFQALDKLRDMFEKTCRHFIKKAGRALPWRG